MKEMLELTKFDSEDTQDHLHAHNLSKGRQGRKSVEHGKNPRWTWERTSMQTQENMYLQYARSVDEIQWGSSNIKSSKNCLEQARRR